MVVVNLYGVAKWIQLGVAFPCGPLYLEGTLTFS